MLKTRLRKRSKAFTLLELVVVIAIIAVLVLIASPRFTGKTKEARAVKHINNVKVLEDTMDRYVLDKGDFPRLTNTAYTSEEVKAYADKVLDITGKEVILDPAGNYYDIDYLALKDYVKVPSNKDKANYVLQNPVGKVFYLEGLSEVGKDRADYTVTNPEAGLGGNDTSTVDEVKVIKESLQAKIDYAKNLSKSSYSSGWDNFQAKLSQAELVNKNQKASQAQVDGALRDLEDAIVSLVVIVNDDTSNAPGAKNLIAGDMTAGYFGLVPASELFTGAEISSAVGITEGTLQNNDAPWLKFAIDGQIIYKSQKTYRHSISWNHINSKGAVDGTKKVAKNGVTYGVRLMKGANKNPADGYDGAVNHGSEWNRLMLPIHERAKNGNWNYKGNVKPGEVPNDWNINFSDANLNTHNHHGHGSYQWCQETYLSYRLARSGRGVSNSDGYGSGDTSTAFGWSPVLYFSNN